MDEGQFLAERFEAHRGHLRAVGYRMLGSLSEAEDAVQEAWLHVSRAGASGVENLGGWLTTIVARVCLDMLRARKARHEQAAGAHLPDPIVTPDEPSGPEQEALQADAVALALLVVLDTLAPAERLAFVLHDLFALPFEEIAGIVGKSPAAARQLASRARRRVQGAPAAPDADRGRQRAVVQAFLAASRQGDLDGLLAVLDPEVVLRADRGAPLTSVRGARNVAGQSITFSRLSGAGMVVRPVVVNGQPGVVAWKDGRPLSVLAFTIRSGKIVAIDILVDPARLQKLDLPAP
jgi:RNA polymerase sigma factor (sigma-70 family)